MPSASDLLKKHSVRVKNAQLDRPRIQRKGATRPWQENLDKYGDRRESVDPGSTPQVPSGHKEDAQLQKGPTSATISAELPTSSEIPVLSTANTEIPRQEIVNAISAAETRPHPTGFPSHQSERAAEMMGLIADHGFDIAMKYLLIKELANEAALVQCSQQFMVSRLKISLKSAKRLFEDLCDRKLIELAKDADPSTKAPKEYRLLSR